MGAGPGRLGRRAGGGLELAAPGDGRAGPGCPDGPWPLAPHYEKGRGTATKGAPGPASKRRGERSPLAGGIRDGRDGHEAAHAGARLPG